MFAREPRRIWCGRGSVGGRCSLAPFGSPSSRMDRRGTHRRRRRPHRRAYQGGCLATLLTTLIVLLGLSGQDLRRWSLDHRGYLLAQIIVARTELEALGQLLERRPDLRGTFLPPQAAR